MATILIVDLMDRSAFLLRAMLRGARRHQVSIATRQPAAFDRLETGMFDLLFVDLGGATAEAVGVVEFARQINPTMPIVGFIDSGAEVPATVAASVVATVQRPFDGAAVKQAMAMALAHRDTAMIVNRRGNERRLVSIPVTVQVDDLLVPCRTFNLSVGGAAVMPLVPEGQLAATCAALAVRPNLPVTVRFAPQEYSGIVPPRERLDVAAKIVATHDFQQGQRAIWSVAFEPRDGHTARDLEILLYDLIRQAA